MGRRAKKAPVVTKKRVKLAKRFKCPFCANEDAVECKMDFKAGIGSLNCRLCGAAFQMPIHHLHEPIDVFSEWLDDCEAAQNPRAGAMGTTATNDAGLQYAEDGQDEDDEDDLPESSGLANNKSAKKSSKVASQNYQDVGLVGDSEDDDDDDDEDE